MVEMRCDKRSFPVILGIIFILVGMILERLGMVKGMKWIQMIKVDEIGTRRNAKKTMHYHHLLLPF